MRNFLVTASLFAVALSVPIPAAFHKCNRQKADFEKCVLEAAQNGITQLTHPFDEVGIPDINPFLLPEARLDGGDGPVGISQTYRNLKLYGFNTLKLDQFRFDFAKGIVELEGVIPELRIECDYETKGRILAVQVNGKGNATVTLTNLRIKDTLPYEVGKRRGKNYIKIVSSNISFEPQLVHFDFDSITDQDLTQNLTPVLNENWKVIFDDVKNGYAKMCDEIIVSIANRFFKRVSMEEAFD